MAVAPKPGETVQFQTWTVEGQEWEKWTAKWLERVEQYYKLA
jgi:hypothetical protein